MDRDAYRQSHCPAERYFGSTGEQPGEHHTHSHSFRYVVQCHREHHHGRSFGLTFRTLSLLRKLVQVRHNVVEQQQEQYSEPEPRKCRHKGPFAHRAFLLINGRYQKAPDRSGDHYARSKASQCFLNTLAELFSHEENAGRAERGSEKRYCDSAYNFRPHKDTSLIFTSGRLTRIRKQGSFSSQISRKFSFGRFC